MNPQLLNIDDLTDRASLEAMVEWAGGPTLEQHREAARVSRLALEAEFTREQREVWAVYSDAATDAATVREEAVAAVALATGIAVGAALTFTEEDPEALTRLGSRVAASLLASGMPLEVAHDVTRTTLAALGRAERVAALLAAQQVRTPGGHPITRRAPRRGSGDDSES